MNQNKRPFHETIYDIDVFVKNQDLKNTKDFVFNRGTILYLHDFGSSYIENEKFIKNLTYYEYHAINFYSHGSSLDLDRPLNLKHLVDLVVEYIKNYKLNHIYLIGTGLGAYVGALVARLLPKRFEKLVLVSPLHSSLSELNLDLQKVLLPQNLQDICYGQKLKFYTFETLIKNSYYQKDLVSELNYMIERTPVFQPLFEDVYSNDKLLNTQEAYLQVKNIPTLVILGNKSQLTNNPKIEEFFKNNFEKVIINKMANCGYYPSIEAAGRYYFNIMNFFNNNEQSFDNVSSFEKAENNFQEDQANEKETKKLSFKEKFKKFFGIK